MFTRLEAGVAAAGTDELRLPIEEEREMRDTRRALGGSGAGGVPHLLVRLVGLWEPPAELPPPPTMLEATRLAAVRKGIRGREPGEGCPQPDGLAGEDAADDSLLGRHFGRAWGDSPESAELRLRLRGFWPC